MSIAEPRPILTFHPDALKRRDSFNLMAWDRLRERVAARAEARAKAERSEKVEVSEDDIDVCLKAAVSQAVDEFLK